MLCGKVMEVEVPYVKVYLVRVVWQGEGGGGALCISGEGCVAG